MSVTAGSKTTNARFLYSWRDARTFGGGDRARCAALARPCCRPERQLEWS